MEISSAAGCKTDGQTTPKQYPLCPSAGNEKGSKSDKNPFFHCHKNHKIAWLTLSQTSPGSYIYAIQVF